MLSRTSPLQHPPASSGSANDPVFVWKLPEPLPDKLLSLSEASEPERIEQAFQWALTRMPTKQEMKVLVDLLAEQRIRYQEDEASALIFVQTGEKPLNPDRSVVELAAWTSVTRALLNLYETTARFYFCTMNPTLINRRSFLNHTTVGIGSTALTSMLAGNVLQNPKPGSQSSWKSQDIWKSQG